MIITGRNISGKSTLCHILINYALKCGWNPIYCDLNIKNNDFCPPGCIGATLPEFHVPVMYTIQLHVIILIIRTNSCLLTQSAGLTERLTKINIILENYINSSSNTYTNQYKND